jgi:hypothetical protein
MSRAFLLLAAGGMLQTLGETLALGASGAISTGSALVIFCSTAASVALLCAALSACPAKDDAATPEPQPHLTSARKVRLHRLATVGILALLALAALWTIATSGALLIQHPLDPSVYDSDAAAFIHYQAEDVLRGINPYTDTAGFWKAVQQFPDAGATPLQRGQFAGQNLSPNDATISALLQRYAKDPDQAGPEFDPASLHSYPAGSFLLAAPFIWAGFSSTQPLYLLCLLLLFGLLLRWTPRGSRWQTALLLVSLSIPITLTLRSSFEVACILCVVVAWHAQARHPLLAAVVLGVGCAIKQLTWLFLPFYLIWTLRQRGWRAAALAGTTCLLIFMAINGPFILASPTAWASSILLPVTEPAFPGGIGLITLAQGGLTPLLPTWAYTTLEAASYLGLLGWFSAQLARAKDDAVIARITAWGLVLAPLPLLLGPRSLISYTMFLPILALAALWQQRYDRAAQPASLASLAALASAGSIPEKAVSNE